MNDKLYPILTEEGKSEAEALVKSIVKAVVKELDDTNFYCNIPDHIESDSWCNFRNSIMDGMKDYTNAKTRNRYDFKKVREVMLRDHREEIIKDLNQDLVEEIESLKQTIDIMRRNQYDRY